MNDTNADRLKQQVLEENIRLHKKEAVIYDLTNPQVLNFYHRRKVRRDINFILRQLAGSQRNGGAILDLGCGTGFLALGFLKAGAGSVTAVDISTEMLGVFRTKISEGQQARAKIVNEEVMAFIAKSQQNGVSYDAVVMSALLHHLVDIEGFVKSASQMVRPGGFFYVSYEPLKQEIKSRFRFFLHRIIRTLDEALFRRYLKVRGFEVEEKGMADYQTTQGGIEPHRVINSLGDDFQIVSLDKFCVRASGILAFVSDAIIRSENTFSVIARRKSLGGGI